MPDPISGGPRPLPSLPQANTPARPGTPGVTETVSVTTPATSTGDPVRDVVERGRATVAPGAAPSFTRTVTRDNRRLDLRLDADGIAARGTRDTTLRGGTRTDAAGVTLDRGGATVEGLTTSNVTDGGRNAGRLNSLSVRFGSGGPLGTGIHRSTDDADDGAGNVDHHESNVAVDAGTNGVSGRGDSTTVRRRSDGSERTGTRTTTVDLNADGIRATTGGRVTVRHAGDSVDVGGELSVTRGTAGTRVTGRADGTHEHTHDGVTTTDHGAVGFDTDGNEGTVTAEGLRSVVNADGTSHRLGGNVAVSGTGGHVGVDGERTRGTADHRVTDRGNVAVDVDANGVTGTLTGGRRTNVLAGTSTITTDSNVTLRGGTNGMYGADVALGRTVVDSARGTTTELGGTAGVTIGPGVLGGTVGGAVGVTRGDGVDRVARRGDVTLRGANDGTVSVLLRGSDEHGSYGTSGHGITGEAGLDLGPGTLGWHGTVDGRVNSVTESNVVTNRFTINAAGGLPAVTVGRDTQDSVTGRGTVTETTVDGSRGTVTVRGADRTETADGSRDRSVTVSGDLPNRGGGVAVSLGRTAADGTGDTWNASAEGNAAPPDGNAGLGVGLDHVIRTRELLLRRGGRVDVDRTGFAVTGGQDAEHADGGLHNVGGRISSRDGNVNLRVDDQRRGTDNVVRGVGGTLDVGADHAVSVGGIATRLDPQGNRAETGANVGVGPGLMRGGVTRSNTAADGTTSVLDVRAGLARGTTDALITRSAEFENRLGRLAFGVAGRVHLERKAEDRGEVTDVPELAGQHVVVFTGSRSTQTAGSAGVHTGVATVAGGVQRDTARDVTFVTYRPADEAATAAAASGEATDMPDAAEPLKLREREQLSIHTSGTATMSADLGAFGLAVSGKLSLQGDFTFTVTRLAGTHVMVTMTPQHVRSVAVGVNAGVLNVSIEKSRAHGLTQTYDVDLGTPAGRAAYEKAMKGDLPSAGVDAGLGTVTDGLQAVTRMNAKLPDGVRAIALGMEETRASTEHLGLSWAFFGVDTSHTLSTTESTTATADKVETRRTLRSDTVRNTWFSGQEQVGLYASMGQVTCKAPDGSLSTDFNELCVGYRFDDSLSRGEEYNGKVVEPLRHALGWNLQDLPSDLIAEHRALGVELRLGVGELDRLTAMGPALTDIAKSAGVPSYLAKVLEEQLRKARTPADRAQYVQAFVQFNALGGLGTLARALPGVATAVQSEASFYAEAKAAADQALQTDGEVPPVTTAFRDIASHFHRVFEALVPVELALQRLQRDDLMDPADRQQKTATLEDARTRLRAAIWFTSWPEENRKWLRELAHTTGDENFHDWLTGKI